ncbi:radical SAM protein [Rhodomicrobium vannielii ATCC 17100]|uniref:radical SAM protein n=1 Tax=Rhodomicrobium vannielii TaxID=1069 RepID=UPI001917CA1D|nr:radical SAM protein [Rhodomicrobium vannielii]MBJ7533623.1 radical SAM protein [Rhodomicrobium vannielii ATCC 17100]
MHQAASASTSRQSSAAEKFADPVWTAKGERRASVPLTRLDTVWFNTGTLCNIACEHCYIESSPKNDRLAWLTLADAVPFLEEMARLPLPVSLVGFTGGEPFMNADFIAILEDTLARGFETLTLTNALKPMEHRRADIARLAATHGPRLRIRVSLDDFRDGVHDRERGGATFARALDGLGWLWSAGVRVEIAARSLQGDDEHSLRRGFAALFAKRRIVLDCEDPQVLVLLPEMRTDVSPPEITEACWGILRKTPDDVMCSNARMVVKRKGAARPAVVACTLLPYDERFELGATLDEASRAVPLVHPWCATFCVLGGGSCGSARAAG